MSGTGGQHPVPVLVITGPVGVGKSSVAEEIFDQLAALGIPHAVVDLDGLGLCWPYGPADPFNQRMALRNLAAVWRNYAAAGADRVVIARVIESREELDEYRRAIPGADIDVCRLVATARTLEERVARREAGSSYASLARRAAELADRMERHDVADFTVETDGRELPEIAREVLRRARWLNEERR